MKNLEQSLSVEKLEERFETSALAAMAMKCVAKDNTVSVAK
jgi:hypothetical protein